MGLIKAAAGAFGGTMADQWKEFFYCEAMDKEVMVVKGTKRSSSRSSNKHGSDNIISSGSGIAVADGQCMMIVEQGKVVEVCADPGEYTYDASTEPSIFSGSLGDGIRKTFDTIGKRFAFGGDRVRIRGCIILIPRSLWITSLVLLIRSRSGLWIPGSGWMWMWL